MDPGSHVGFQISTKNTNLVEDHPVNISGKFDWYILGSIVELVIKLITFLAHLAIGHVSFCHG
jgi:hypothetical protein